MVNVKPVPKSDEKAVIDTVVKAFSADPVATWFYPDPQQYLEHFPRFVEAFAGAAFQHASAYGIANCAGVALWLPPGSHADEQALAALLERTIAERNRAEVLGLIEQMDKRHPAEPHWYLPMIGVIPEKQGHGYGAALLEHTLERCDAENALAYLEASSLKSIRLYERHGFERFGTIQVGSSPPLFPMLRKPRRSANADRTVAPFAGEQIGVR